MRLYKETLIYISGEILSKATPFLLLPYLTRKLGANGYGELAYYQASIAFLLVFVNLSQDGAIARAFYVYGRRSIGLFLFCSSCYSIITSLILIMFFYFLNEPIFIILTITCLTQSLIRVQLSLRQCQKKVIEYTIIQFSTSTISVFCTVFLFEYYGADAINRIYSVLIANVLCVLIFYFNYVNRNDLRILYSKINHIRAIKYLLGFGFPLIFHQFGIFAKGQVDRVLIYEFYSKEQLGIYSSGLQIASILLVLLIAVNKALTPYYYQRLKSNEITEKEVINYFQRSFLLVPVPVLVLYLIPIEWFTLFLGSGFELAKYYSLLFVVGLSLNIPYFILVGYFFYKGKNKLIAKCTAISTVVYLICVYSFSTVDIYYVPLSMTISNLTLIVSLYYSITNQKV